MLTLPIELDIKTVALSDEQFYQFCISNPDVRAELTAEGSLILMPPVGGYSGNQEFELGLDLGLWNRKTQLGKVFSSSTISKTNQESVSHHLVA
ncbi:MAG: Uma2 family endonuclease [Cyanobacteria bacterium J06576_12]